jgi:twitching motility two-component system response regulator PilG
MATAEKILVIDDDEDFRESVRPLLENEGYVVIEADSGKDGLDKLIEHEPDVIVLDIMMETLEEGYGVNAAIRFQKHYEEYRHIPIIMVSSILETPVERYPYTAMAEMIQPDFYLTKPLEAQEFVELLRKAIDRRGRKATP